MPQFLRDIFDSVPVGYLVRAVHIIFILVLAYIVYKMIDSGLNRLGMIIPSNDLIGHARMKQRTETLRSVVRSVSKAIIILFVILQIGSELGFLASLAPLLATAGIGGLAVGFGAQSLVKDVISGFFILSEDQFGVGDVVKIGDFSGVVERMTLRATVLRNLEGQVHVVPNGNIQNVTVMTKEWARAVLDLTIPHEEPIGRTFEVLERVGNRLAQDWPDCVLEQPTILGVEKIDDSGVTVRSIVKTPPFKNADVLREWRLRAIEEFDRAGIRFAQRAAVTPISNSAPAKSHHKDTETQRSSS
jgi:moderate conductance mechanosensitive channel